MNITYGQGAFFMAGMDEIRDALQEAEEGLETLLDKLLGFGTPSLYEELSALVVPGYCPTPQEIERNGWRSAAALTRSKAKARAKAFACRMESEKARRAMKRRKLLRGEGRFPDMAC